MMTEILHSPHHDSVARNPLDFDPFFRCRGNTKPKGFEEKGMEIGTPTNVRHVAHVTYDRFNGFLGLPVEFEPEVPRRPPSASTRVFGVSTESMHLSFDSRGNCVPTILLMMQRRLYLQEGLQSEGIFRINPENGQEEYVRQQLNNGMIPDDIDVHCLAGLIKAWFRELPRGILDSLSPEQVMEAQSEDECTDLVGRLPSTEAALLDWAVNLMADVAQLENANKMNAHNISVVFAPNMTQMSDPLTALMYAVQVMNFLKTLVTKTLREREGSTIEAGPVMQLESSDDEGHQKPINLEANEESNDETRDSLSCIESVSFCGSEYGDNGLSLDGIPKSSKEHERDCGEKTHIASEKPRLGLPMIKTATNGTANEEMSIVSNIKSLVARDDAWR